MWRILQETIEAVLANYTSLEHVGKVAADNQDVVANAIISEMVQGVRNEVSTAEVVL